MEEKGDSAYRGLAKEGFEEQGLGEWKVDGALGWLGRTPRYECAVPGERGVWPCTVMGCYWKSYVQGKASVGSSVCTLRKAYGRG